MKNLFMVAELLVVTYLTRPILRYFASFVMIIHSLLEAVSELRVRVRRARSIAPNKIMIYVTH